MKFKKFNFFTFSIATLVFGILLIPAFFGAFAEDEGTLNSNDTFLNFFAQLFKVLRFPTHTLFWSVITSGGIFTFFGGLILNLIFYGFIVERISQLFYQENP